jgi:SSS family transporter
MGWIKTIVIVYLLIQFLVGLYFFRRVRSESSYVIAGGKFNSFTLGSTLSATQLSSATALGDVAYTSMFGIGYYFLIWPFLWLGYWISAKWVARKMLRFGKRAGGMTIPDILAARYDSQKAVRSIAAIILILSFLFDFGTQYRAAGIVLGNLFHLPYIWAVIIAAVVFISYTLLGGLLSIAYNDIIQICLFVLAYGLGAIFAVKYVGGFGHISSTVQHLDPSMLNLFGSKGLPFSQLIGIGIATTLMFISYPIDTMKFYSAKNNSSLLKGIGIAFVFQAVIGLAVIALGFAGRALHPNWTLAQFDSVIPAMAMNILPPVVGGLIMAIVMGAVMAVSSSIMLTLGAALSHDLFVPLIKPNATDKQKLLATRLGVLIIGVVATFLAFLSLGSIASVIISVLQGLAAAFSAPLLLGLVWKKVNRLGAILSMIGGAVGVAIWIALGEPWGLAPAFLGLILSILGMVIGIFVGKPISPEVVEPFFEEDGDFENDVTSEDPSLS